MNLLSKLHKNSILTGPVESYCLACGCLLCSEEECYAHIHKQDHVDNLEAVPRLENYKEDCIFKIKEGYFCPFCNVILPTIKRVSLHVTESKHRDNKNTQSITRHGGLIFAFDVVTIDDRSWHGLDGTTCFVCNKDYDDEEEHKRETSHVLNLIQIKCEFGECFIYRDVDEDLFFCLICNDVLPIPEKPTHHQSERHLELYDKSKAKGISIRNKPESNKAVEPNNNNVVLKKPVQISQNNSETKNNIDSKVETAQNGNAYIHKNPQQATNLNITSEKSDQVALVKLNTENTTQVLRTNGQKKSSEETAKVSKDVHTKLNTENKEEHGNKPKTTVTTDTVVKNTEPKIYDAVNDEADKSNEVDNNIIDSHIHKYLKACNYIINIGNGGFCVLCSLSIEEGDTLHSIDKHHSKLYEKEISRKNVTLSENFRNVKEDSNKINNKTSETIGLDSTADKENAVPLIEANNKTQKAIISNLTTKTVSNDTVAEKNYVSIEQSKSQTEDKPNNSEQKKTTRENKTQNGNIAVQTSSKERHECKIETESIPVKKVTKKSQRKATKTKTKLVAPVPTKESNQSGTQISTVCKTTGKSLDKEQNSIDEEELDKSLINSKDAKKNLDKVLANGDVVKKNQDKVIVNGNNITKVLDGVLNGECTLHVLAKARNGEELEKEDNTENGDTMAAHLETDADLKTEKLLNLLKTVSRVDSSPDDVVINSKYVLGNLSFVLVVRTDVNAECVACDQELIRDDVYTHVMMEEHRSNVEECLVVTSLDDEFIRQVKTQEYHCGYCNMLLQNWEEMKRHLQSYRHSDAKTSAKWRLERYYPHLKHCQNKEVKSVLTNIFRSTRE